MSVVDRPHHKIWPKRLPRELVVPQTSLWFNLEVAAARYPDKTAFLFFGKALTYAELKAQAEALAGWLQAQGVGSGDRVALYLQNCPQFVVALYAIFRANAVAVPVNPMNRADELLATPAGDRPPFSDGIVSSVSGLLPTGALRFGKR